MFILKNKPIFIYFLLIINTLAIISLSSCNAVKGASQAGSNFYTKIQNQNFEEVLELLTEETTIQTSKKEWVETLQSINKERGKVESFSKVAFSSEIKNEIIITTLTYNVIYRNGIFKEKIIFHKQGEQYKIQQYLYKL